jgi:hypothetical protein
MTSFKDFDEPLAVNLAYLFFDISSSNTWFGSHFIFLTLEETHMSSMIFDCSAFVFESGKLVKITNLRLLSKKEKLVRGTIPHIELQHFVFCPKNGSFRKIGLKHVFKKFMFFA